VTTPQWAVYLDTRTARYVDVRVFESFAEVRQLDRSRIDKIDLDEFWTHYEPQ
jgi:hypothetical protein